MPEQKSQTKKGSSSKTRREGVRKKIGPKEQSLWRRVAGTPGAAPSLMVALGFVVLVSAMVTWSQREAELPAGRIADRTRAVRVEFQVRDGQATERERERRRNRAPRVYQIDAELLSTLRNSIQTLPEVLARAETLEQVVPEVRDAFKLTPDQFLATRSLTEEGVATPAWSAATSSAVSAARGTSIMVPISSSPSNPVSLRTSATIRSVSARRSRSSVSVPISGCMISGTTVTPSLAQVAAASTIARTCIS